MAAGIPAPPPPIIATSTCRLELAMMLLLQKP
jgi:hypothetical protein